jgi:hypothetical protein
MPGENQAELMRIFQFTETDLQENRKGVLSEAQKQRIKTNASISFFVLAATGLVFGAAFLFSWGKPVREVPLLVWAFFLGLFPLVGLLLFWAQRRVLRHGIVKCLGGVIDIQSKNFRYTMLIDNVRLIVAFDIRYLIKKNAVYRVYYLPANMQIMAIEEALNQPALRGDQLP